MSSTAAALGAGDVVLLVDQKQRRYLLTLEAGREFHSHAGFIAHDDVIGQSEGSVATTTRGQRFRVWRPTLADFVLKMPRGAQVIYPKDLGPITMLADVAPGMSVFEAGVGSGALSMTLLRAGAHITAYELREDFAARARANVLTMLGPEALDRYDVSIRSAYDGIDETGFDRMLLDLPEPWQVVRAGRDALRPGGILVAYTPSVVQVNTLRTAIDSAGFELAETIEILQRSWHVADPAVRPDHRMVAHTGFLTHARRPA